MFLIFAPLVNILYYFIDKFKSKTIKVLVLFLVLFNVYICLKGVLNSPLYFLNNVLVFDRFAKETYLFTSILMIQLIFKDWLGLHSTKKQVFLLSICLVVVSVLQFRFLYVGVFLYFAWLAYFFFNNRKNESEKILGCIFLFGVLMFSGKLSILAEKSHLLFLSILVWIILLFNLTWQKNRRIALSDLVIVFMFSAFLKKINTLYPLEEYLKTLFFLGPIFLLLVEKRQIEIVAIVVFFMCWIFDLVTISQALFFIFGYYLLLNSEFKTKIASEISLRSKRNLMLYLMVPLFAFLPLKNFNDVSVKILLVLFAVLYTLRHMSEVNLKITSSKRLHRNSFYSGVSLLILGVMASFLEVQ